MHFTYRDDVKGMMEPYNLEKIFNHDKNYTELHIENYFLRKTLNLIKTTYKYSHEILYF